MKIRELFYKKKLIINSLMMLEFLQKKEKKKKGFSFSKHLYKNFFQKNVLLQNNKMLM